MAFDPKNSSMIDSEQKRCRLGRSCFHKCLPQSQKSNLVRILDSHYFEHQLEQKCMELHQSLFSLRISKTFSIMISGITYAVHNILYILLRTWMPTHLSVFRQSFSSLYFGFVLNMNPVSSFLVDNMLKYNTVLAKLFEYKCSCRTSKSKHCYPGWIMIWLTTFLKKWVELRWRHWLCLERLKC